MREMKKEADVKEAVKEILRSYEPHVWWYMPVQNGFGVRGIPDFIACVNGKLLAIETKFGRNPLSEWQKVQIDKIRGAGGIPLVVTEKNTHDLDGMLAVALLDKEVHGGTAGLV